MGVGEVVPAALDMAIPAAAPAGNDTDRDKAGAAVNVLPEDAALPALLGVEVITAVELIRLGVELDTVIADVGTMTDAWSLEAAPPVRDCARLRVGGSALAGIRVPIAFSKAMACAGSSSGESMTGP